jgi:hypothetical protein
MAVVYRHIRLDKNQPFYIGIGDYESRAYIKHGRNPFWNNIINKTEYRIEILFDDLTWENAQEKEIELISLYGRKDIGTGILVNLTHGGENPPRMFGHKYQSGEKNSNYGKNHTEERKRKISETLKGQPISEERRKKISETLKGHTPWNKGKKGAQIPSEESKLKMSISRKNIIINEKSVIINDVKYISMSEAGRQLGLKRLTVRARIESKTKTFEKWIYA